MDVSEDTKICARCGRTLPASEFRSGTLNVASDECTDCVWERMCAVTEADFRELDNKAAAFSSRGEAELGMLRHGYRRYQGDNLYRTLESIRNRLLAGSRTQGTPAHAEAGYVGFAAQLRKRRTPRHGAGGCHTADDVQRLYEHQRGRCFYCGAELTGRYRVDHKTPLSRGGSDWPENLCCACDYCASRKEDRTAEEFAAYLADLRRRRS